MTVAADLSQLVEAVLPDEVALRAFGEVWPVEYRHADAARVRVTCDGSVLALKGAVHDASACLLALQRWRDRVGKERLPVLLEEVSSACGIGYERVTVRGQRTRWGSCSSRGTISLNRNLMFLPEELVRYVMLHELVHMRVPNHSKRFWDSVTRYYPEVDVARAEMRRGMSYIPPWALVRTA